MANSRTIQCGEYEDDFSSMPRYLMHRRILYMIAETLHSEEEPDTVYVSPVHVTMLDRCVLRTDLIFAMTPMVSFIKPLHDDIEKI